MTAISRCLATQHPCPQLTEEAGEAKLCTRPGCPETIQECYNLRRGDAGTVDRSDIGRRFQAEYEHVPVLARPAPIDDILNVRTNLQSAEWAVCVVGLHEMLAVPDRHYCVPTLASSLKLRPLRSVKATWMLPALISPSRPRSRVTPATH